MNAVRRQIIVGDDGCSLMGLAGIRVLEASNKNQIECWHSTFEAGDSLRFPQRVSKEGDGITTVADEL